MTDLSGLVLVVVVGTIIVVGGFAASWARIPAPLMLIALGGAVGFIPALHKVSLPPEVVLLLFLPPLLYWEALNTSLREMRANLRTILLLSVGLVLATTAIVAVVAHAFGLPWPISIALGAILAPTDATAVAAVANRMPRRTLTTLRAESLVNDATALAIYSLAVAAAVSGESIEPGFAVLGFLVSCVGAVLIGAATVALVTLARRVLRERPLLNTVSVLTPFLAYLPAEALHVSGVVAVVVAGLGVTQYGTRFVPAEARHEAFSFWRLTTFILNGALFALVGIELHDVTNGIGAGWTSALVIGLCLAITVVLARMTWTYSTPYALRLVDRLNPRAPQRPRTSARNRFPLAWAGFRGAVSLAAALALPTHNAAGEPLHGRELVIAVTFVVIVVTLLAQGLTMRRVVDWAQLPEDPTERDEELLAEQVTTQAALDALPTVADGLQTPPDAREEVTALLQRRIDRIHRDESDPSAAYRDEDDIVDRSSELRLQLMPARRKALYDLRDHRRIDDLVMRRMQARLDIEELRLRDTDTVE